MPFSRCGGRSGLEVQIPGRRPPHNPEFGSVICRLRACRVSLSCGGRPADSDRPLRGQRQWQNETRGRLRHREPIRERTHVAHASAGGSCQGWLDRCHMSFFCHTLFFCLTSDLNTHNSRSSSGVSAREKIYGSRWNRSTSEEVQVVVLRVAVFGGIIPTRVLSLSAETCMFSRRQTGKARSETGPGMQCCWFRKEV